MRRVRAARRQGKVLIERSFVLELRYSPWDGPAAHAGLAPRGLANAARPAVTKTGGSCGSKAAEGVGMERDFRQCRRRNRHTTSTLFRMVCPAVPPAALAAPARRLAASSRRPPGERGAVLSRRSDTTLAEQLTGRYAERVRQRLLAPGARLPSVRECARRHSVRPATLVSAYDQLFARGLVEARAHRGFFVRGSADDATRLMRINFATSQDARFWKALAAERKRL